MSKKIICLVAAVCCAVVFICDDSFAAKKKAKPAKAKPAASAVVKNESMDQVREKLKVFSKGQVMKLNSLLRPNRANPKVTKLGKKKFVATFEEVDMSSLQVELKRYDPATGVGIGYILYRQNSYVGEGATSKAATSGQYKKRDSSNKRELVTYRGGAWR